MKQDKHQTSLYPEHYEVELYKELRKKLNHAGFILEDDPAYEDLVDKVNRLLIEVTFGTDIADDGASQLLYGMAKNEIKDMIFLGLADSEIFNVFKTPEYGNILTFAQGLDPGLSKTPSSFKGKKIAEAFVVLGEPIWQGFWRSTKDTIAEMLKGGAVIPFIAENLFEFHRIFGLYKIKTTDVISAFTGDPVVDVAVTNDRIVVTKNTGEPVSIKYRGTMSYTNKWIIQRMRIPDVKAVEKLRQTSDRLQSVEKRAERGAYYTEALLSMKMGTKVLECVKPDFIIDPYAGAGSLLIPFVNEGYVNGWVNDYDEGAAAMLGADYGSIGYHVTCEDMIRFPIHKALDIIGDAKDPLFITNPPWSSTSGKKLKEIEYSAALKRYGKGNQIYPTIGKVIEIMKQIGRGHLAFFSSMGIFCERKAHMKFLTELLKNFTFVQGYIWSGKHFNDVRPEVPVAFSIWKCGGSTDLEKMQFDCESYGLIGFKRQPLLKDGWKYEIHEKQDGEIAVQRNDLFNYSVPKLFHNKVEKSGGSEVIQKNVKKSLNIVGIPDELVYALWSTTVGQKSLGRSSKEGFPLYDGVAYVHLPDFNQGETKEILAYALLYAFIGPNYTEGQIGFIGPRKVMKFGNSQELKDGANYLFNTYGHLPLGEKTISDVLDEIKKGEKPKNARIELVKEISKRLDAIGYWDYIPLPLKKNETLEENEGLDKDA